MKRRGNPGFRINLDYCFPHGHRIAFACEKRNNYSGKRAGELDERLGGLDFDEHIVNGDGVANLDAPLNDFGLGEAFTDVGERKIQNGHG